MKTVRVRIAVAVTNNGFWQADGWSMPNGLNARDSDMSRVAIDNFGHFDDNNLKVSFVEADIPIPEPQTIEGEVK